MARVITKPTGKSGVGRLFAGGCFDEVGARHHGDEAGAGHVAQGQQIAGAQNDFHVRWAAGLLERGDLIVEFLPSSAEDVSPGDDDVDLVRSGLDRAANFGDALGHRRKASGKSRGNGRHSNAAAFERPRRRFDKAVIDANRRDLDFEFFDLQLLYQVVLDGLPGLGAQAAHALVGVVAGKSGQIHAGDGAQQPGGLPFFFHRAARNVSLRPALHRAGVDANLLHPVEIQRDAAIREQRTPGKRGDGRVGGGAAE